MLTVGVDPGLSGRIALWDVAPRSSTLTIYPVPVLTITVSGKKRSRVDTHALQDLADAISAMRPDIVLVEDVGGMPRQSAPAAFSFGRVCGALEQAFTAARVPLVYVTPAVWKKEMRVGPEGDDSRAAASRLFPDWTHLWPRKGDHDAAEAALLAWYARTSLTRSRSQLQAALGACS